jgi:hypothetical protein
MTGLGMELGTSVEYGALLRMWGRLQTDLSVQCQAHAQALKALESEVLRLRAELMITRTALYWGMAAGHAPMMRRPLKRPAPPSAALSAADQVLCRTACEGHAHHWLDDNSGCTRTGQPCHRLAQAR